LYYNYALQIVVFSHMLSLQLYVL